MKDLLNMFDEKRLRCIKRLGEGCENEHIVTMYEAKHAAYIDAIELITEHMEGKVIVPAQLIRDIDDLTEAGFGAENEIDELCALLSAISEGDK